MRRCESGYGTTPEPILGGFRRAYHDACGQGWLVDHKMIQRLWRDEGLRVPQRHRRKPLGASTVTTVTANAPNRV